MCNILEHGERALLFEVLEVLSLVIPYLISYPGESPGLGWKELKTTQGMTQRLVK